MVLALRRSRFSGPLVAQPWRKGAIRQRTGVQVWGFGMDRLVGLDPVRGPIPFNLRKFPGRQAGCFRIKHRSSDRRWWPRSVATTLISGSPPTRNSYCGPRWYAKPVTIRCVLCEFTERRRRRSHRNSRSSVICAAWATFIAARSGKEYHMPTYAAGSLRLQQLISGKMPSRECRNRLTRRRVNRCPEEDAIGLQHSTVAGVGETGL